MAQAPRLLHAQHRLAGRASEPGRAGFSQEKWGGGGGPLAGLRPSARVWGPPQEALGRWAWGLSLYRDHHHRTLWARFTVPQGPRPSLTKRITDVQQDEAFRNRTDRLSSCRLGTGPAAKWMTKGKTRTESWAVRALGVHLRGPGSVGSECLVFLFPKGRGSEGRGNTGYKTAAALLEGRLQRRDPEGLLLHRYCRGRLFCRMKRWGAPLVAACLLFLWPWSRPPSHRSGVSLRIQNHSRGAPRSAPTPRS